MPRRRSAVKSHRKSVEQHVRNQSARSRLTTEKRKFERAIERGDLADARARLNVITGLIQKAAAKGVLPRNTAARRQALFQKHMNKAESAAAK